MKFPPPRNLAQLQSLPRKEEFMRRFITNYAHITKGFMRLLKKDTPFIWDKPTQCSFDALKQALTTTLLLSPLNYNNDFLLYLATYETTIGMVLVQTNDDQNEHIIYCLSKGLVGVDLCYAYIEKLALSSILVVQIFWHYILLQTTTVIFDTNPM